MAKIAVEEPFEDIKQVLENKGHSVHMFVNNGDIKDSDIGVVRHLNEFNETKLDVPFVIVSGKSVEEVVNEVESTLNI